MVHVRTSDAWVQLCCLTGRVLRAQRPPSSVRMLVLLKLRCSVSGAVSMGGRPRKRSACASGVDGAFGSSEMPNSRVAMRHQARVLANAIAQSSVGAGAAGAERCLIDGRVAQKMQRICFGGSCRAGRLWYARPNGSCARSFSLAARDLCDAWLHSRHGCAKVQPRPLPSVRSALAAFV